MMLFKLKSRLYLASWAIGVVLLFSDYAKPFQANLSDAQFWLGILFCMVPTFFLLLDETISANWKVVILLMWGTLSYLPKILRSPNIFGGDEVKHFQTAKLIYENGNLDIQQLLTVSEIPSYYPGLELITVSSRLVTGLPLSSIAILLIGFIHSLLPVLVFLILKNVSSNRIAAIGAFIYTGNSHYFFFDSMFSYEVLGIFFVLYLLFLISRKTFMPNNLRSFSCLSLIALSVLVFTHHLSSFMFLLFAFVLVVIQYRKRITSIDESLHLHFAILAAILVFSWMMFVATIAFDFYKGILATRLEHIVKSALFTEQRVLFRESSLPTYEIFIDTYLYIPLTLLFSWLGVHVIRKEERARNAFIRLLIFFGPILYSLSLFLLPTYSQEIAYRMWPFLFVGVSLAVGHGLHKMIKRRSYLLRTFAIVAAILIVVAGISLDDMLFGRFNGSTTLVSGPDITSDVICASDWFEKTNGRYNTVLGDRTVQLVFGGYGVQKVGYNAYEGWRVFFPRTIDSTVKDALYVYNIQFVIVNELISGHLAKYRYYFSSAELEMKDHPGYGNTQPLPKECLDKFDISTCFDKVFSDGRIDIYRVLLR